MHKNNFGMKAKWHFFATLHGKNACDGVRVGGGLQLHDFAKSEIPGITRLFVDKLQVDVFSKKNFSKQKKTFYPQW